MVKDKTLLELIGKYKVKLPKFEDGGGVGEGVGDSSNSQTLSSLLNPMTATAIVGGGMELLTNKDASKADKIGTLGTTLSAIPTPYTQVAGLTLNTYSAFKQRQEQKAEEEKIKQKEKEMDTIVELQKSSAQLKGFPIKGTEGQEMYEKGGVIKDDTKERFHNYAIMKLKELGLSNNEIDYTNPYKQFKLLNKK